MSCNNCNCNSVGISPSGVSQRTAMENQIGGQNTSHAYYGIQTMAGAITVDDKGNGKITTAIPGITVPNDTFMGGWITSPNLFPNQAKKQAQQGWECPRCNTIHAPFIPKCECK